MPSSSGHHNRYFVKNNHPRIPQSLRTIMRPEWEILDLPEDQRMSELAIAERKLRNLQHDSENTDEIIVADTYANGEVTTSKCGTHPTLPPGLGPPIEAIEEAIDKDGQCRVHVDPNITLISVRFSIFITYSITYCNT